MYNVTIEVTLAILLFKMLWVCKIFNVLKKTSNLF